MAYKDGVMEPQVGFRLLSRESDESFAFQTLTGNEHIIEVGFACAWKMRSATSVNMLKKPFHPAEVR